MKLHRKLQGLIGDSEMSQREIAEHVGVSRCSLANLMGVGNGSTRGRTDPAYCRVQTMVGLLELFPELELEDFIDTSLRLDWQGR